LSSDNIGGITQTLAKLISNGIRNDIELQKIVHSEELVSLQAPSREEKPSQLSLYLYNVTECTNMRNQPQNPTQPHTLMYLNLRFLITPTSRIPQLDQLLLGKVMQILGEKPMLRGSDLQGSLSGSGEELKVTLDALSIDDLNKLWGTLDAPHKLCISYSVYPVPLKSEAKQVCDSLIVRKPVTIEKERSA
jgi:hypothetical protein